MQNALREMLVKYGRVSPGSLPDNDSDLFAAGLDSFGMVDVMMVAEEEFGVVFTPAALNRRSFTTVNTLVRVIAELRGPDRAEAARGPVPHPKSSDPVVR